MKKILIIEDEKILGEMYRDKFTQAGFDVVWVDSAEEGIKAVPKIKPDLILLDILLPRANGIGFMGWLRKEKELSSIPVVAFSNYDEPTTKKEALKLGVKDYLIKTNYTPQEIVDKIKGYLE
ncbi:MAG: response regulator [bacterium]|nr:response regulator [bacterium]